MTNDLQNPKTKKRTPSRTECENMIKKILLTEVENRTVNATFKKPSDFMSFFESLYPPSPALSKQVQRAIKSLNMAKDENGYYILNKSQEQSNQDNTLKALLLEADYTITSLDSAETIFLQLESDYIDFVMNKLANSISARPHIITMIPTINGILIYTNEKSRLFDLLDNIKR